MGFGYRFTQGLEALDSARQLYQRAEFGTLRLSFLRTLFTTLLRRSHSLLQDEIILAIHSIVSVVRCDAPKEQQPAAIICLHSVIHRD